MDLNGLAEEYRAAADRLQARIGRLRVEALTARGEEAFTIRRRIDALYTELCDLREVMTYLRNYYEE